MFSKVLVANRAEIAVRGFRAAYELGARTVAVFPHEDRNSEHRLKADEAYPIGAPGHPVRAYLDIAEIIRVARASGADAVYPGYGFLSENPDLARACAEAGIAFVGPPAEVLEMAGNKVTALRAAKAAGIPVLTSSEPSADPDELLASAEKIGFMRPAPPRGIAAIGAFDQRMNARDIGQYPRTNHCISPVYAPADRCRAAAPISNESAVHRARAPRPDHQDALRYRQKTRSQQNARRADSFPALSC